MAGAGEAFYVGHAEFRKLVERLLEMRALNTEVMDSKSGANSLSQDLGILAGKGEASCLSDL